MRHRTVTICRRDPRNYQVAALASLLGIGLARFGFDVPPAHVAIALSSALVGQWWASRMGGLATPAAHVRVTHARGWSAAPARGWNVSPERACRVAPRAPRAFEWKSALISGLSLCLLLRARNPLWMALAALVAVSSKFLLRVPCHRRAGSKHVLNPANGAIVLLLACGAPVWVSPAQWGHHLALAFGVAGFGSLVVHRSSRSDVTLAFLAAWTTVLFGRAWLVGQAWAAPIHQLENG